MSTHVLTLSCPDRAGLVHAVSGWVVSAGGNILDSQQFSDMAEQMFYLRLHVDFVHTPADLSSRSQAAFSVLPEQPETSAGGTSANAGHASTSSNHEARLTSSSGKAGPRAP